MSILHLMTIGLMVKTLLPADVPASVPSTQPAPLDGLRIPLTVGNLFVPSHLRYDGAAVDLLVHFHGDPDTVAREFLASGLSGVLVTVNCKGLSATYAAAFQDARTFGQILDDAIEQCRRIEVVSEAADWGKIRISSFSAGYGAVREIIKARRYFDQVDGLCMADSIYAGYVAGDRRHGLVPQHLQVWRRFATAAVAKKKTFILTHTCLVPDDYASTFETADDLIAHVGANRRNAMGQMMGPIPLLSRASKGNFMVYGCAGADGEAHMHHLRHLRYWIRLFAAPVSDRRDPVTRPSS